MNTKLLSDAADWRLISVLFERPANDWHSQIAALASETSDKNLKAAAEAATTEANVPLYDTTFGPGGPAAPREVSHRQTMMPGQMLDELGAYYKAFAYQPTVNEIPDHIAVETGFIAYLRLKQAYALERGDAEQAAIAAAAAKHFIEDHLNAVAEPLAKSLAHSGIAYLSHTAAALLSRVGPRQKVVADDQARTVECDASGCVWADDAS
jgi:nitrate reductase assembly molybdenum cofactor insertion protein NarJ